MSVLFSFWLNKLSKNENNTDTIAPSLCVCVGV